MIDDTQVIHDVSELTLDEIEVAPGGGYLRELHIITLSGQQTIRLIASTSARLRIYGEGLIA